MRGAGRNGHEAMRQEEAERGGLWAPGRTWHSHRGHLFSPGGMVSAGVVSGAMLTAQPPKFPCTLGPRRLKEAGPPTGPEIVRSSERLSLRLHPNNGHCGGGFLTALLCLEKTVHGGFTLNLKSQKRRAPGWLSQKSV